MKSSPLSATKFVVSHYHVITPGATGKLNGVSVVEGESNLNGIYQPAKVIKLTFKEALELKDFLDELIEDEISG